MKRAAVIAANGFGDALLMMIASHRLQMEGYAVTTYHHMLPQMQRWFDTHRLESSFETSDLSEFDLVILQHDNSARSKAVVKYCQKEPGPILSIFYGSYSKQKHPKLTSWDQIFDEKRSMADNIASAVANTLNLRQTSKNNGLTPPDSLVKSKYPNRIILHPSAGEEKKIWPLASFIQVAKWLKKKGYDPVFAVSERERPYYMAAKNAGFELPILQSLDDLAVLLYESGACVGNDSGTCHLASNMHLPTLVISDCYKRMRLWRPGWRNGEVLTPPRWIPNLKGSRVRENHWRWLASPAKVIKNLKRLSASWSTDSTE